MVLLLLRGISKITAAATGLTLAYGISYALDGMTTRIPVTSLHELVTSTLSTLPWTLLFCSGVEDLGEATQKTLLSCIWTMTGLGFLYYLEHFTRDAILAKTVMPFLTIAAGLLPHFVRRISLAFTIVSLATGVAGLAVICFVLARFISGSTISFATTTIGSLVFVFVTTSLATGVLSILSIRRQYIRIA